MSGNKVLVIDDSATIRRLVDSTLSRVGYQVVLAPTAEEGLKLAEEIQPDVILLDHQLPGTTGYEVCCQLAETATTRQIPIIVSSTLRKRAYVEYAEKPNVVDMLPKPYTEELLRTTIANAVDTGALVVESQEQGTAVPEVIRQLDEPDVSGSFGHFSLREILDFLNNAGKCGVLEVEGAYRRTYFFLDRGRIEGVTAAGVDSQELVTLLPQSLQSLAPVLKLTLGGRGGSDVDGIVELLNRKVLDPRLLRKLLRYQASILTWDCFTEEVSEFRFHVGAAKPPLQQRLPLETSLLALLIEGSLLCDVPPLAEETRQGLFVRRMMRGQNLDRAGVPAHQMKLLGLLAKPQAWDELIERLQWDDAQLERVLSALLLCEAIERKPKTQSRKVVIFESNPAAVQRLRESLPADADRYACKVVKDPLALQMVLRRERPDALIFALDDAGAAKACRDLYFSGQQSQAGVKWLAIVPANNEDDLGNDLRSHWSARTKVTFDAVITRPYRSESVLDALDRVFDSNRVSAPIREEVAAVASSLTTPPDSTRNYENDGLFTIDA
jgi:CheY-like chemotaxis protein